MKNGLLEEGDVIKLEIGHTVYAKVPEHFLFHNRKGYFRLTRGEVTIKGDFDYLAGTYVVYKTTFDGGGQGHGPGDVFPNGHHVFCKKAYEPHRGLKVDFYQTGCFTAMIPEIEPIGKAKLNWNIE